jgi:hypothetical protein
MIQQTLTMIITPDQQLIEKGQIQLQALELLETYTLALTEIAVDNTRDISVRQLAGVLLRKYITKHWTKDIENFVEPEVPDPVSVHVPLLGWFVSSSPMLGQSANSTCSSSRIKRTQPSASCWPCLCDIRHRRMGLSRVMA